MKKEIERLLIYLIPAIFIERIIQTVITTYTRDIIRGDDSSIRTLLENTDISIGSLMSIISFISTSVPLLPLIVVATWLWHMEKRHKGRPYLWAMSALFINYWILLLYLGQLIYNRERDLEDKST